MTTLAKVWMPYLVSTMLIRWQEELNAVEGNACNYSCPMWKPSFCTMATKVSWIAWWVLVCLLPWAQHKRWIPIGLMGCVHTHRRMPTIEGWVNPSCIQSVV
jgi:hypothetical protein